MKCRLLQFMYWSDNWLSIDTRTGSVPRHIKESFVTESDREDAPITKRILQHLSVLLGKAFTILMAYQGFQGGRAHFVSHTTKGEGKEQTPTLYGYKPVLFYFTVTATALIRQIYSTTHYLAPSHNPLKWQKRFWKTTISGIAPLSRCWTVMY